LWRRIQPLIPQPRRKNRHVQYAGRKRSEDRKIMTGIIFSLKTGVPWQFLPATSQWPSGYTCLRRLKQWHRAGVWYKLLSILLSELQHKRKINWRRVIIDSSSIRLGENPRI